MIFNVKTDSRKVQPGDIFIALKTVLGDGHNYVDKAIENGASKVVVSSGSYDVETIVVSDTRKYLSELLQSKYKKCLDEMVIVGITGTNGKTTTTSFIYQLINSISNSAASLGSLGYFTNEGLQYKMENTTPDICDIYECLIDAYNKNHKYFILEASSQGLDDERMIGLQFDYAVFTNLTRDHLDHHKTMKDYALAKQKLFKSLKSTGVSVLNIDDSNFEIFKTSNYVTFGKKESDYQIKEIKGSTQFSILRNGQTLDFEFDIIGEFNVYNFIPALIILEKEKYDPKDLIKYTKCLVLPLGRMDHIKYKTNNVYIDYAHTPDGIEKIVSTIKSYTSGKVYTLFGGRGNRDVEKRPFMMESAVNLSDFVILTSIHTYKGYEKNETVEEVIDTFTNGCKKDNYIIIKNREEAINYGLDLLKENDSLLLLGLGHEKYLYIEGEKIDFDESKIVLDYINNQN